MSLKNWILHGVHRMNGLVSRADLPAREPEFEGASTPPAAGPYAPRRPRTARRDSRESGLTSAEPLGAYALLIDAIRDELEHFVASQVRLHLAIADHDRFLLTAIGIACGPEGAGRPLLQQFVREFKPEQVKRYLAREVIGGLANAAAIDLSQFAGLFDADAEAAAREEEAGGEYRELIASLRSTPTPLPGVYRVSVVGRWVELDAARRGTPPSPLRAASTPPLPGERCEFDVEDGSGRRRVVLQGVVAGRRYVVGNGDGADVRVEGTFASRRHAELWLEDGSWWVADAGSTNGVRVEPTGLRQRRAAEPAVVVGAAPVRVGEGGRIVLSARAEGPASDYPWLALRQAPSGASLVTPIASTSGSPRTPRTAILPTRAETALTTPTTQVMVRIDDSIFRLSLSHAAGVRTLPLGTAALPVSVGRSRHQTLVVDRSHEGVSGNHLDIVELDDDGATVVVHGDNGVLVDGERHPCGARLRWRAGQTLVLGEPTPSQAPCSLELALPKGG